MKSEIACHSINNGSIIQTEAAKIYACLPLAPESHEKKGESANEWDKEVLVPGAFKVDHLHPSKSILFKNFSNFFTLILGARS